MLEHRINLAERSYDIVAGSGIIAGMGERVRNVLNPSKAVVITDSNVGKTYLPAVIESMKRAGISTESITFEAGEDSKSLDNYSRIMGDLLSRGMDRKSCLIALGGGVVGDLTGFLAATFMRGIPFVQVPTSLLAQVDSSSGGKTGVNHPLGKNLIGSFHQPSLVLIDVDTLKTLPREELLSGLGEVVKHGMIRDPEYFALVERNPDSILNLDSTFMQKLIIGSCRIKGDVVSQDEREGGVRALLNFGHTFGHAYENLSNYKIRHGDAVAAGMIAACHLSELLGKSDGAVRERLLAVLSSLGMAGSAPDFPAEKVLAGMYGDKKTERGKLRVVLVPEIGKGIIHSIEDENPVLEAISLAMGK